MKRARDAGRFNRTRKFALALAPVLAFGLLGPGVASVAAQAPCPAASGVDAEAGWLAFSRGDLDEARRRFESALETCGADAYARTGLGYVELRRGRDAEAVALWSEALAVEPRSTDALVGLGLAAWRAGDLEGVRGRFTEVLEHDPDHPVAREYLARLTADQAPAPDPVDPADEAWFAGDTERALQLYQVRLQEAPEDPLATLRVALMRGWAGRYAEARVLLDGLVVRSPLDLEARVARARVAAWSGDQAGAVREAREVLRLDPEHAEALDALSLFLSWSAGVDAEAATQDSFLSILQETGAPIPSGGPDLATPSGGSRAGFDALLAANPEDLEARLGLARFLAVSGAYEEAIEEYRSVSARAPLEVRALVGEGRTLGWAGRLREAETAAQRAVEADPGAVEGWALLGQVRFWRGRSGPALEALREASGLAPNDPEVRDLVRAVERTLAPSVESSLIVEDDSDGHGMVSSALVAGWHPATSVAVRVDGRVKRLRQDLLSGGIERRAESIMAAAELQLRSGWTLRAGAGAAGSDGTSERSGGSASVGVRSPDDGRIGVALDLASARLDETAVLAERGVRSTSATVSGRWGRSGQLRIDGSVGIGAYEGTERNGRRSASLAVTLPVGAQLSLGSAFRGYSFQRNLNDGYFDPDFFGLWELMARWQHRPLPWTLSVELAPGLQQVTSTGDPDGALRSNTRVGYRLGAGREISLTYGYSSAGLRSFATGAPGYRYHALVLGFGWLF